MVVIYSYVIKKRNKICYMIFVMIVEMFLVDPRVAIL